MESGVDQLLNSKSVLQRRNKMRKTRSKKLYKIVSSIYSHLLLEPGAVQ